MDAYLIDSICNWALTLEIVGGTITILLGLPTIIRTASNRREVIEIAILAYLLWPFILVAIWINAIFRSHKTRIYHVSSQSYLIERKRRDVEE